MDSRISRDLAAHRLRRVTTLAGGAAAVGTAVLAVAAWANNPGRSDAAPVAAAAAAQDASVNVPPAAAAPQAPQQVPPAQPLQPANQPVQVGRGFAPAGRTGGSR